MARILILCTHHAVASGRYMRDAFKRLGHDVRTMGERRGNQIWGLTVKDKYVWTPDYLVRGDGVIPTLDWRADLVLQMDTEVTWADKVLPGMPRAVFSVDNHVKRVKELAHWDKMFLAHHDGPAQPVCEDCGDVWLPCAYDDAAFTPSPLAMHERTYDVAVVGVPYERRVKLIAAMAAAGLKVYANTGLLYDEYRDAYHNARISLCVSACGDVAQRIFETASMGCMLLTDYCADFDRLDFHQYGQGMIYESDEEAVRMAKMAIGSPKELKRIASEGQAWARPHTWTARAQTILDTMELK